VPPSNDFEQRLTALEAQVRELAEQVRHSRQDAAAARVLAGGADRDVAEIRTEIREFRDVNNRVLNAMREDLTDLRNEVRTGFTQIRGVLDAQAAGQQQIVQMLTTLMDQHGGGSAGGE
jgi:chromosome segregation ATPase